MTEQDLGKILSAQLMSLISDNRYGYRSKIAGYSHLKDEGLDVMTELIKMLTPRAAEILDQREEEAARQKMMEAIKS